MGPAVQPEASQSSSKTESATPAAARQHGRSPGPGRVSGVPGHGRALMSLQSLAGNSAVNALVAGRVGIMPGSDGREREAESVATRSVGVGGAGGGRQVEAPAALRAGEPATGAVDGR